jgi:hypothetical protein
LQATHLQFGTSAFSLSEKDFNMRTLLAIMFSAAFGFAATTAAAGGMRPPSHNSGGEHVSRPASSGSIGSALGRGAGGEHVSRGGKSGSR